MNPPTGFVLDTPPATASQTAPRIGKCQVARIYRLLGINLPGEVVVEIRLVLPILRLSIRVGIRRIDLVDRLLNLLLLLRVGRIGRICCT